MKENVSPPEETGDELVRLKRELEEATRELAELKSKLGPGPESEDLVKAQKLAEQERAKGEEYLTRLKYLQADFENYRKRVDREIRDIEDFSTSGMMRRLLPVLDDLELAVGSAEKSGDQGILEGVSMVQKNLLAALHSEGLKEIEAVGRPFDPALHEAVERVDGKGNDKDMVVAEIRRGYILKDKVLRPSMVRVESAAKDSGEKQ